MYRLMLVDDEAEIREGLLEIINWEQEGFQVVGVAENGLEALQVAENVAPDLVVTDIRMPFLDGLEMARRMRKTLPTVQFIVLSGYDEFDFARQAVQIQIKDYILKPISSEEFTEVLRRVKAHMDEDFIQRNNVQELRARFRASLPVLREMLLASLLAGSVSESDALESAAQYDLPLVSPRYAVALMSIGGEVNQSQGVIESPELLLFAVMNIVSEVLQGELNCHVFHFNRQVAVLLRLEPEQQQPLAQVAGFLEAARQTVVRYLGCSLAVGVGNPCDTLGRLHHAAEQAQSALNQSALMGEGQVLTIADMEPGREEPLIVDESALRALGNAIKLGNAEDAEAQVGVLMDAVRGAKATYRDFQVYLLEVLLAVIRTARDLELDWPPHMGEKKQITLEAVLQSCELDETEAMLRALCRHVADCARDTRVEASRRLSQMAVEYLQANYGKSDMSLEKVCRHLHISTAYFSTLFKREMKHTLHQYLTELRMDKAMSLMTGTDLKTADVAQMVGMSEPSYFSYSFKKYFGVSPSQARRNAKEARP